MAKRSQRFALGKEIMAEQVNVNVGTVLNIRNMEGNNIWCYKDPTLFANYIGRIRIMSSRYIEFLCFGDDNIHELESNPKLVHEDVDLYCFVFKPEVAKLKPSEEARKEYLLELGVDSDQRLIINKSFPLGSRIEENTRLINALHFNNPKCPQCGSIVDKVLIGSNSYLNREQFDSIKAGDYFCKKCPSNDRGRSPFCYWWIKELDRGPFAV